MFPPDDIRPGERLKAGRGKSDRWRTSRVTEGVYLSSHAHCRSHLRPGDVRLFAVRAFRPFSRPGFFNVFDRLADRAQMGFGLGQLFVQRMSNDQVNRRAEPARTDYGR
jgi:hypothetical protein